jgi:hypothetical protein
MGYLILGVLALFAVYLVAWLAVAGFMWFGVPVLLVLGPATVLAGVVVAFVVAVLTLAGAPSARPATIGPDAVSAGTAGLPRPRGDDPFGRDHAWPQYLVAQWRVDLATMWRTLVRVLGTVRRRIDVIRRSAAPAWLRGLGILVAAAFWLLLSLGAVSGMATILLLCWLVRSVCWAGWVVVTATLRGGDDLVRRLRRASGSCPDCYYVSPVPGFPCAHCQRLHRDIRPGRLGGVWRRCGCGRLLPTTVLRAARRLPATCPRCGHGLRHGAAVLTDLRLPVFGPVFAGKTRLVHAGLLALHDRVAGSGGTLDFVDEDSRTAFDTGARIITSGGDTVKTPAGQLPRAITARLTTGRRRALLHLFDAAGEFYADREDNSDLEFLDHAQGLVFVVDPFSVGWVRDQLGAATVARLAKAQRATEDPEHVYQVTARRLRDFGVDTRRRSLAMTVVKADLLAGLPPAADLHPGQVRDWLVNARLDNLVLSAERDFGAVRYFLVASVPAAQAGIGRSPAEPFTWLMSTAGLAPWPADADPHHQSQPEGTR